MIDLRSDTFTKPTAAMLAAMAKAEVGDDVYGEDPTVRALEARIAELLGFEAALFTSSGTMANQLAVAVHTRPGDTVLCEQDSHLYLFEAGAGPALSGVGFDLLPRSVLLADAAIEAAVKPDNLHSAPTTMLAVENTHNVGAGRVLPVGEMRRIAAKAKSLGLAVHCDGARLWNAAVALRTTEKELLGGFDSAAVCFSKGLGAPVGSALAGTRAKVERARKLRKRWGGGTRQAGYLAAAALHAVEHHRARLAEDHENAAMLARRLRSLSAAGSPLEVQYPEPGTNMVYFRLRHGAVDAHLAALKGDGVRLGGMGGGWIRAVAHLDVSKQQFERVADVVANYLERVVQ